MGSVVNPGGGGSVSSWGTFTGADDVRFPVAMFIHIIEFKMRQEGVTAGTSFGGDEDYFMIMYLIVKEAYMVSISPTIAVDVDDTSDYLADPPL